MMIRLTRRKVLITGASGFVGCHLLSELVGGADEIIGVHYHPLSSAVKRRFGNAVRWIKADIASDDLNELLGDVRTVFHLAGYYSAGESETERLKLESVNVVGTKRLAAACKSSGVQQLVFLSSIAVCESSERSEIDETTNNWPVSIYGETKKAAEEVLLAASGGAFNVTILRSTALFGENHMGSLYELVKAINQGRFVIFGPGTNRLSFYYVGDLIDTLIAVQNNDRTYGQIFIVSDKPYTLNQLVDEIKRICGCKHIVHHMPVLAGLLIGKGLDCISLFTGKTFPLSERRVRAMTVDRAYSSKKIQSAIGTGPTYGVFQGLKRSIVWYRQAGLL